jgi:CheY-like chemotaxis protein
MVLLSSSRSLSPVPTKHKQMILKSNEDANLKAKSQMKILVVDDNKEITEALSFYLDTIGISCTVTNDGQEALQIIRSREDFDLILLDIAMPDFTGLDVIDELKIDNLLSSRNIVYFTASSINEEELLKHGAKGIIRKPISLEELQSSINKFVSR